MLRRLWKGPERRRFPRLEAALELSIELELYGFSGETRPFFASGHSIDIARGGFLAEVDAPITAGSVCRVFFHDAGRQVRPSHVKGRVVRCTESDGAFTVAVELDEPLLGLEPMQTVPSTVRRSDERGADVE